MLTHSETTPKKPERVVAIGARGFIGRVLMRRLEASGIPALGLTSQDLDLAAPGAGDALAAKFKPGDAVVFLSAITPDKGRDRATLMRNLAMANAVCAAIEKQPPAHVVYVSSDAVYPFGNGLVNEETPAVPTDLYGAMHSTRELMVRGAAKCPVVVLRPTLVFGAGDTHSSYGPNRFRRLAAKDKKITLGGAGEETRDHIYVEDVAALIKAVLLHRSAGLLNLVTGESHSFDAIARMVAAQFTVPVEVAHSARNGAITYRHFDNTALRKAFPAFHFTPLAEALKAAQADLT
ncbi:NAD-dependent epimerase/dehydratase family protein [Ferrovibrio sp.]|uniref:NAD-dependent epimerase/dehydratase family protein n=1 Tax=Ferrovibrio sp. TaxID=1917215 RepID=UPI0035B0EE11